MKYYIHKNRIFQFEEELKSGDFNVSFNYSDRYSSLIPLNDAQTSYYQNNPDASVDEIWNMKRNETKTVVETMPKSTYISNRLRDRYSIDDEMDILRHKDDGKRKEEVEAYYKFLNEIEAEAEKKYSEEKK